MIIKTFSACITGLCLLATATLAAADGKGIITTLNLNTGYMSVDSEEMRITDKTRVQTGRGGIGDTGSLALRQHVRYTVNEYGTVTKIRIYDFDKLRKQGYHTGNEDNH